MTRRIIVAVDESAAALVALESAARLAAQRSVELLGLFVEDSNLVSAAGLPGVSIVSYQGASLMPLDTAVLERCLRVRARRLRDMVARIAEANHIVWQFETIRGHVGDEILRIATEDDMIAVGSTSARDRRGVYGSTARMILERARGPVLVVRRPLPPAQKIAVFSTNGTPRETALALAHITGAGLDIYDGQANPSAALDRIARSGVTYLVIDRQSLARLGFGARELAERLKVEGLIVTD